MTANRQNPDTESLSWNDVENKHKLILMQSVEFDESQSSRVTWWMAAMLTMTIHQGSISYPKVA